MRKIFGYFDLFNLNKRRKLGTTTYDDPSWKIKYILRWVAPKWLRNHFESICFDNIYNVDKYGTKRTCLIFSGSKNLYWIFFRRKPYEDSDWKWCLKFMKMTNDHCSMG